MILSKNQTRILNYLLKDFYTVKQIARLEDKTVQSVYKTINKLVNKGALKKGFRGGLKQGVENGGVASSSGGLNLLTNDEKRATKILRLHNLQISAKILESSPQFFAILKKSNILEFAQAKIIFYPGHLDIYTKEGVSFEAYSTDECYNKALHFFSLLYSRIESRLNILLDKEGYLNKKWVRQHIAEVDNEIAKDANAKGERISAVAEDSKTWLISDRSFKKDELEFIHPEKAKAHADTVIPYLDDLRLNNPLTNSQLAARLSDLIDLNDRQSLNFSKLQDSIRSLVEILGRRD